MLKTENITYRIGKQTILNNVSADFLPGECNMILGPNGSGKSSFLKIFSGEINDFTGSVFYGNDNVKTIKKEALARRRAVMSQQPELSFPLTVEEVVMMGRYPHFKFDPNKKDVEICRQSIEQMNLSAFRERNYLTLSGGEKQRAHYARVLAQIWEQPQDGVRYLFLDEPLASLDINYQQEFLKISKQFAGKHTVLIIVIHDINLAIQYADKLFFLKNGALVVHGKTNDIVSTALLEDVFDVKASVVSNPLTGSPLVIYHNS